MKKMKIHQKQPFQRETFFSLSFDIMSIHGSDRKQGCHIVFSFVGFWFFAIILKMGKQDNFVTFNVYVIINQWQTRWQPRKQVVMNENQKKENSGTYFDACVYDNIFFVEKSEKKKDLTCLDRKKGQYIYWYDSSYKFIKL